MEDGAGSQGVIVGLNTSMLWYMLFTEVIIHFHTRLSRMVSEEVKSGDIAYKLVRPYSYILYYFAAHCGEFLVRFLSNLLGGAAFCHSHHGTSEGSIVGTLGVGGAWPLP